MRKLSLNEGIFKDLDNRIVNIDDPDYEQKVKDQTFNDFQESDHQKIINNVVEWITEHVALVNQGRYLSEEDNGTYFNIQLDGTDPVIELGSPDFAHHAKSEDGIFQTVLEFALANKSETAGASLPHRQNPSPIPIYEKFNLADADGGIPFKISKVYGSFYVGYSDITSMKNFPNYVTEDFTVSCVSIKTFEGWYTDQSNNYLTVGGNLIFNRMTAAGVDNPAIRFRGFPEHVRIEGNFDAKENYFMNFTGLSNDIEIGGNFDLSHNMICQVRKFPTSIKIGSNLILSNNGIYSLTGLTTGIKTGGRIHIDNNFIQYEFDPKTKGIFVLWPLDKLREYVGPEIVKKLSGLELQKDLEKTAVKESANNDIRKSVSILSLNEGMFKDLDKTIVSVDDPDYEQKVKDQVFNDFQEADVRQRKNAEIEKWICDNIYYSEPNRSLGGKLLKPEDENTLWSIDSNFEIHLTPPVAFRSAPADQRGEFRIWNPAPETFELPYKIAECSAGFQVATSSSNNPGTAGLKSFKNFPAEIMGSLYLRGNSLQSLKGCPQIIHGHIFDVSKNILTSLKGGPKKVGDGRSVRGGSDPVLYNVSDNKLTVLNCLPKAIYGNLDAHNNLLEKLDMYGKSVYGSINLSNNRLRNVDGITDCIGPKIDLSNNRLENIEDLRFASTLHTGNYPEQTKVNIANNYLWSWIHEQMEISEKLRLGMQTPNYHDHTMRLINQGGQIIKDYTPIGQGLSVLKSDNYTKNFNLIDHNHDFFRFNYIDAYGLSYKDQHYFGSYQEEESEDK